MVNGKTKTAGAGEVGFELGTELELPVVKDSVQREADEIWKILQQVDARTQPPQWCLYTNFE